MGGFRLQCKFEQKGNVPSQIGRKINATYGPYTIIIWEVPLSLKMLKELFNNRIIDFPVVSKNEILDKCGKDAFSKTIAVLQLTWFILQIIARVGQKLTITELELTTAALASLNIAMYISWWSKPNDILCPTVIQTRDLQEQIHSWKVFRHLLEPSVPMADSTPDHLNIPSQSDPRVRYSTLLSSSDEPHPTASHEGQYAIKSLGDYEKVSIVIYYGSEMMKALKSSMKVFTSPAESASEIFGAIGGALTTHFRCHHDAGTSAKPWYIQVLFAIRALPIAIWWTIASLFLGLIYYPVLAILGSGERLHSKTAATDEDVEHMSTIRLLRSNKALRLVKDMVFFCEESRSAPFFSLSAMTGAIFGMIHCLAWNSQFPSRIEKILWRTSSSILVGICVCMLVAATVYSFASERHQPSVLSESPNTSPPGNKKFKKAAVLVRAVNPVVRMANTPATADRAAKSPPSEDGILLNPPSADVTVDSTNLMVDSTPTNRSLKSLLQRITWGVICSAFSICFVLARLSLLVLSIVELRALPASAFDTVRWSGFIPHI